MNRITVLLMSFLFCSLVAVAQEEEPKKGFDRSKLFIGGNFGLSFGDFSNVNISPQLGYRFNEYLAAGMGINMQMISFKERDLYTGNPLRKTSQSVAGLNAFGRLYPLQQVMLQVQPELNYVWGKLNYYATANQQSQEFKIDTKIVPSLLMGAGAVFPAGRGSFIASVFYDVLNNVSSPYGNKPIVNFGYNVGLY